MKKQIIKDSEMFNFFRDYYKFIQDYAIAENQDEFWDELLRSADNLCRNYKNNKYCIELMISYMEKIEREYKGINSDNIYFDSRILEILKLNIEMRTFIKFCCGENNMTTDITSIKDFAEKIVLMCNQIETKNNEIIRKVRKCKNGIS